MDNYEHMIKVRLSRAVLDSELPIGELANKCGVTRPILYRCRNGQHIPNSAALGRICKALGVSADWILGISGDVDG